MSDTTKFLSRGFECDRCHSACTPEFESGTIRNREGEAIGHLCPACMTWAEQATEKEIPVAQQLNGEVFMRAHCT